MADEVELTVRFGLLALLLTLLIAVPKQAGSSRIRNAIGLFVLIAGFLGFTALLAEALAGMTLYAVPASFVVIIALLWWVIEPKITPRLRVLLPAWQTVQAFLAWVVRTLGLYGAAVVYAFVLVQLPYAISFSITLASGLGAISGLLLVLRRFAAPAGRSVRWRRWGGFALVVLGMVMTFSGSYGVSALFDFPDETGTRGVIMWILFGPVYSLGLPVFVLGLWLIGKTIRRRD